LAAGSQTPYWSIGLGVTHINARQFTQLAPSMDFLGHAVFDFNGLAISFTSIIVSWHTIFLNQY
jgi:hypothetical protein